MSTLPHYFCNPSYCYFLIILSILIKLLQNVMSFLNNLCRIPILYMTLFILIPLFCSLLGTLNIYCLILYHHVPFCKEYSKHLSNYYIQYIYLLLYIGWQCVSATYFCLKLLSPNPISYLICKNINNCNM